MQSLSNKVCVVTGGAGSLGQEAAKVFLQEGAKVVLVDLNAEGLKQAVKNLNNDKVIYKKVDVTNTDEMHSLFSDVNDQWGKIDVIVSNAGNTGVISPITELPEKVFDDVYAVHVKGAFLTCKYGIPQMNDGGSIIIVSSVAGLRGDPGVSAYITAKHAQIGLMRSVAKEVAPRKIRVNTIHPGPVNNSFQLSIEKSLGEELGTDGTAFFNNMIPLGRHASPSEIANSILFLASNQSSFMTGSTLVVDGGMNG